MPDECWWCLRDEITAPLRAENEKLRKVRDAAADVIDVMGDEDKGSAMTQMVALVELRAALDAAKEG